MRITEVRIREELGNPSEDLISSSLLERIAEESSDFYSAVARAAKIIAHKFSLEANKRMGPLSIDYHDRAKTWFSIAEEYKKLASAKAKPFAGGISLSDKKSRRSDPDRPPSSFYKGMFEIGGREDADFS